MSNTEECAYQPILDQWDSFQVVLAESYALATALNTARANQSRPGAFGVVATTFNSWIEGLWEQHGTGQRFVSQPLSVLLMRVMINEGALPPVLADTPNLPVAAAQCASRGSGVAAFEAALAGMGSAREGLPSAEEGLLDFIRDYRTRLAKHGLIERGSAVAYLGQQAESCFSAPVRVCVVSQGPLPLLQREFFAALGSAADVVHLTREGTVYQEEPSQVAQMPAGVTLSFSWPAGHYAKPQALKKILDASLPEGPVVIAAQDPFETYHSLMHVFKDSGCHAAVRARMPLLKTQLGSTYAALHQALCYEQGQAVLLALADALCAPLFGMRSAAIARMKAGILGNRLVLVHDVVDQMAQQSDVFAQFLSLMLHPNEEALSALQHVLDATRAYPPAQVRTMKETLDTIGAFLLAAVHLGVPDKEAEAVMYPLLDAASVTVSQANYASEVGQAPDVLVLSQWQAAALERGACATVVIDDLNSSSYPAAARDNAVTTFLSHVGVTDPEDFASRQRRTFACLVNLPTKHVVLGRCLHDPDMKELYPAAMLEEFLDVNGIEVPNVYEQAAGAHDKGDSDGFPIVFSASEDDLLADAVGHAPAWERVSSEAAQLPPVGADRAFFASRYVVPQEAPDAPKGPDVPKDLLRESPSHLEIYHECPRKWFVSRLLDVTQPGEGFGAMERGSYIHECVQEFYAAFRERGFEKVTPDNIEDAQETMRTVIEAVRCAQYNREAGGWQSRYVAVPGMPSEEAEYLRVEQQLVQSWLDVESDFLAGTTFAPTLFEYPIDKLGAIVGEVQIKGRVDRIDIDEEGNLVIVDYKGSLGPEYATSFADGAADVPFAGKKLQTLLYAAAIRKAGKLVVPEGADERQKARIAAFNARGDSDAVVAAVYFSYNNHIANGKLRSAGFFCEAGPCTADQLLLNPKDESAFVVPVGKEEDFFKSVAAMVKTIKRGQMAGNIAALLPHDAQGALLPVAKSICAYCPDECCEERQG